MSYLPLGVVNFLSNADDDIEKEFKDFEPPSKTGQKVAIYTDSKNLSNLFTKIDMNYDPSKPDEQLGGFYKEWKEKTGNESVIIIDNTRSLAHMKYANEAGLLCQMAEVKEETAILKEFSRNNEGLSRINKPLTLSHSVELERKLFKVSVSLYTCSDQTKALNVNRQAAVDLLNTILSANRVDDKITSLSQHNGPNSKTIHGISLENIVFDINFIYNQPDGNNDTITSTIYYEKPDDNGETEKKEKIKLGGYNQHHYFEKFLNECDFYNHLISFIEQQRILDIAEKSASLNGEKLPFKTFECVDKLQIGIPGCSADIVGGAILEPCRRDDQKQRYVICAASSRNRENTLKFARVNCEHPITPMTNDELVQYLSRQKKSGNVCMYIPMIPSQKKVDLCLQAAYHGITVLAEKPFLCTAKEIEEFNKVYNNMPAKKGSSIPKGKILVGQHSTNHPCFYQLASYIKNYGKAVSKIDYSFAWPKVTGSSIGKENRCYDVNGGGPILDLGVYAISFFHFVLGEEYNFKSVEKINPSKVVHLDEGSLETQVDAELLYVHSKDKENRVQTRMDVSIEPHKDGKSHAIVEFSDGSKVHVKDPCQPQHTPDKSKWLSHMDKKGNAIDVQAMDGITGSTYGCQLDVTYEVAVNEKEVPEWMTLESAHKNAMVMDALFEKIFVKKNSGNINYDWFKTYCEQENSII